MKSYPFRNGFTLIELLVVIAIIATLAVVVVLTLNPAELLRQSRDANRISDMATLSLAIGLYNTDQSEVSSYSLGTANTVYPSVYDPAATTTAGTNCSTMGLPTMPSTYFWHCAASSTYRNASSNGWIPINFQAISAGSPFGSLPVDPTNNTSSRLYYTYTTNGTQFEVTAPMQSTKYQLGGSNDQITGDGASLATVYAKGSNPTLEPLDYGDQTLVGYWPLNEGTNTVAYDDSGSGTNGTWSGAATGNNGTYYTTGQLGQYAGIFNGTGIDTYINIPTDISALNSASKFSWTFWFNPSSTLPSSGVDTIFSKSETNQAANDTIMYIYTGNMMSWQINNGADGGSSFSFPTSTYGTWNQIIGVFDGTQTGNANRMIIYLNGVQQTLSFGAWTVPATSYNMAGFGQNIGMYDLGPTTSGYTGSLDDFRIYNRALSATEIQALYNSQK